jgi:hypothetical protein
MHPNRRALAPAGRKLTEAEQERWIGTTEDVGFHTDGHRITLDENLDVLAGATAQGKRPRAFSTADAMERTGTWPRLRVTDNRGVVDDLSSSDVCVNLSLSYRTFQSCRMRVPRDKHFPMMG